jgi:hypothetical protein
VDIVCQEAEMKSIARVVSLLALVVVAWPAASSAADKPKNQLLANGIVKTVSATSLTVTADAKDTIFAVDAKTKVHGKGIGTKSQAKGGKPTIPDLLKEGDRVSVTYQQMGTMMHAMSIEVTPAGTAR